MVDNYLDADWCSPALAAAEVVAALRGKPVLPDDVAAWVSAHADLDTTEAQPKASQAVQHILAESELKELFQESDEYDQWVGGVNDLLARLRA